LTLVALGAALATAMPEPARAQGFLDALLNGSAFGRSGREVVAFTKQYGPGTIVVSFGDRRLYYVTGRGQAISYPIGVPTGRASWSGVSHVSQKRVNPDWTPTPEMRAENPELPAFVPGGHPRNPLGVRALYLGDTLYRIHGTDAPWTIGQQVSHGCIRLYNQDIVDLYNRVRIGATVIVTWKRFYG
jgi:lipoprotein-anchoring transpeptidase ErfK/SrfK